MTRRARLLLPAAIVLAVLGGCAHFPGDPSSASWKNLLGAGVGGFDQVGEANWRMADGAIVADKGDGYLVTRETYGDFEMRAEFYAEADTNSGILVRCQDPVDITPATCYEVNIWDTRPGQEYSTGAIVAVAKVDPAPKAGGKWNSLQVTMKRDHLVVVLNGAKTVDVRDAKLKSGVIALQHAKGVKDDLQPIKFRKVEIRPL